MSIRREATINIEQSPKRDNTPVGVEMLTIDGVVDQGCQRVTIPTG